MSESDGERAARSVALEQAYVHEVYEQCAEKTAQSRHWPRIYKFLEELEPGALVCDIGCGNGKYLSINDNVFKIGADRCKRLTDIAREKENEVMICDNLALPFRDESFDAVLSIAVVHHFATTERRVNALKELARVLRIGGRLVISVWAMEQRHRKFESQDVLVPWPKAYCLNATRKTKSRCNRGDGRSDSFEEAIGDLDANRMPKKCPMTSGKRGGKDAARRRSRSYWIDPIFSPSPSTSSLSSPNETCYSFFRRALQKLAGGKRGSAGNRAWFLETWHNGGCKSRHRARNFQNEDTGDVDDIPIELRRLEEDNVTLTKHPAGRTSHGIPPEALGAKSKSLGDILEIQRLDLVRSRSSIPGFSSTLTSELYLDEESKTPSPSPAASADPQQAKDSGSIASDLLVSSSSVSSATSFTRSSSVASGKPRLVKQKSHVPDESPGDLIEEPATGGVIRQLVKEIGESEKTELGPKRRRRGNVHKQSSMNEELMSMERLVERERVRKNIMKQASLNEEIICKPSGQTFSQFRDSLYSGNATKRLQLIKSDLTNRIKQSTTSMENKVSSIAIKNGFAKILQSWKQSMEADENGEEEEEASATHNDSRNESDLQHNHQQCQRCQSESGAASCRDEAKGTTSGNTGVNLSGKSPASGETTGETIERRLSKEDGSDSSKDSSLQSDTSVDSEDSFASVIYVPKNQQQQQRDNGQQQNLNQLQQHSYNFYQQDAGGGCNLESHFPSLKDVATSSVASIGTGCRHQLRTTSAPPSPRIKHPPDICHSSGPRLKLISMSPLLKQFPATSKSLPPPSPPGLSPHCTEANSASPTNRLFPLSHFFPSLPNQQPTGVATTTTTTTATTATATTTTTTVSITTKETTATTIIDQENNESEDTPQNESTKLPDISSEKEKTVSASTSTSQATSNDELSSVTEKITEHVREEEKKEEEKEEEEKAKSTSNESINDPDTRHSRLNQIKELLRQKPGFATRNIKSSFPLVRRASSIAGRSETAVDARSLPRLLSLELFNPETDDLDSDSSGLSSPESVGSVISVISDQRFSLKNNKDLTKNEQSASTEVGDPARGRRENDEKSNGGATKSDDLSGTKEISDCSRKDEQGTIDLSSRIGNLRTNCKYSQLVDDTIAWLSGATSDPPDNGSSQEEYVRDNNEGRSFERDDTVVRHTPLLLPKSISEEEEEVVDDFVMISKSGEFLGEERDQEVRREREKTRETCEPEDGPRIDSIENSMSLLSDASQTDEATRLLSGGASTLSLGSSTNLEYKTLRERRKYLYQKRSASEEIPRSPGIGTTASEDDSLRVARAIGEKSSGPCMSKAARRRPQEVPLSGSSSQESLPSDREAGLDDEDEDAEGHGGGGAITYHQYYHVFREGELDQLINKYVENLHIISSYYDHASWCIVAEKVQVWTI